jgi:hypothetical protein
MSGQPRSKGAIQSAARTACTVGLAVCPLGSRRELVEEQCVSAWGSLRRRSSGSGVGASSSRGYCPVCRCWHPQCAHPSRPSTRFEQRASSLGGGGLLGGRAREGRQRVLSDGLGPPRVGRVFTLSPRSNVPSHRAGQTGCSFPSGHQGSRQQQACEWHLLLSARLCWN